MRWVVILAIVVVGVSMAQTSDQTSWEDLLFPNEEQIKEACDRGYEAGEKGERQGLLVLGMALRFLELTPLTINGVDAVSVALPLASVYFQCSSQASELLPKDYNKAIISARHILVGLHGVAANLDAAKSWATAIALEGGGSELVRVQPIGKSLGELKNWKTDCSRGGTLCVVKGVNFYTFLVDPFRKVANKGERLALLFNIGNGVNRVAFTPLDFVVGR